MQEKLKLKENDCLNVFPMNINSERKETSFSIVESNVVSKKVFSFLDNLTEIKEAILSDEITNKNEDIQKKIKSIENNYEFLIKFSTNSKKVESLAKNGTKLITELEKLIVILNPDGNISAILDDNFEKLKNFYSISPSDLGKQLIENVQAGKELNVEQKTDKSSNQIMKKLESTDSDLIVKQIQYSGQVSNDSFNGLSFFTRGKCELPVYQESGTQGIEKCQSKGSLNAEQSTEEKSKQVITDLQSTEDKVVLSQNQGFTRR